MDSTSIIFEADYNVKSVPSIALQLQQINIDNAKFQVGDSEELDIRSEASWLTQMDDMRASIEGDAANQGTDDIKVQIFLGVTTSLTAGFVAWVLQSGSLLAGLMGAIPLINRFNLLPILKARDDDDEVEPDDDTELTDTEITNPLRKSRKRVENMFSEQHSS